MGKCVAPAPALWSSLLIYKMTSAAELSWGTEIIYCILLCILDSERANQSIQQLSSTLEQLSPDGEEVEEVRGSDGSLLAGTAEEAAWSQKTQSEAGDSVISCGMADSSAPGDLPAHSVVDRQCTKL